MFHGLSITKLLGGISKSLTIAEQIIPIYQKISPSVNNLRNIISNIKTPQNTNTKQIKTITNNSNSHNPTFFN